MPEWLKRIDLNCTELNLYSNQLSGPIPPALGALTALQELDLSSNQLSGPNPPALGALTALQELDLSSNHCGAELDGGT